MQKREVNPESVIEASERYQSILRENDPMRTQAGTDYMNVLQRLTLLNSWLINLEEFATSRVDEWKQWSTNALKSQNSESDEEAEKQWSMFHDGTQGELFLPHICEMMFCKIVDAYQVYVSDTIGYVYRKKPAILRSAKENLTYEFVLDYTNMDELINAMIDRKVNQLAYNSVKDLDKFCQERGIQLFADERERDRVMYLVETRNIIVHNKGTVNHVYKTKLPNRPEELGSRIVIDQVGFLDALMELTTIVATSARRIGEKFDMNELESNNNAT